MARIARVVVPGQAHHIHQRGIDGAKIFTGTQDREDYLKLLREQADQFDLNILAYCLLENDIYLAVVPKTASGLARGIGEAHRRYTRLVNARRKKSGFLFQGRFYSCPAEKELVGSLLAYIDRTPVRKGLSANPAEYAWASGAYHLGQKKGDPLVTSRDPLGLGLNFKKLLQADPAEIDLIRSATRTGRPMGGDKFRAQVEKKTGRSLAAVKPRKVRATPSKKSAPQKVVKSPVQTKLKKGAKLQPKKPIKAAPKAKAKPVKIKMASAKRGAKPPAKKTASKAKTVRKMGKR